MFEERVDLGYPISGYPISLLDRERMFGRLQSMGRSMTRMEVIIDVSRERRAHTCHLCEIGHPCTHHALQTAEVRE